MNKSQSSSRTQWHPAFCSALHLELKENKEDLIFHEEFGLNTKPILIDALVVTKSPHIHIHNEIGRNFRGHNIFEYKSPGDALNIDDFYMGIAYTCLYKTRGRYVNGIRGNDITLTFVRREKPIKLFNQLEDMGMQFRRTSKGIYQITGKYEFLIQIMVTKELDRDLHTWITSLTRDMTVGDARKLAEDASNLTEKDDKEYADSVLQVAMTENEDIFHKAKGVTEVCEALRKLMKPEMDAEIDAAVNAAVAEKNAALEEKNAALEKRDARIKELEAKLAELGA